MEVELTNGYRFELTSGDYARFKGIMRNTMWHCGTLLEYLTVQEYELKLKISEHSVEDFDMLVNHRIRNIDDISFPVFELANREWHDDYYVRYNHSRHGDFKYYIPRKEVKKLPYSFGGGVLKGCPPDDMLKNNSDLDINFLERLFPEEFEKERMVDDYEREHYVQRAIR